MNRREFIGLVFAIPLSVPVLLESDLIKPTQIAEIGFTPEGEKLWKWSWMRCPSCGNPRRYYGEMDFEDCFNCGYSNRSNFQIQQNPVDSRFLEKKTNE